MLWWDIADGDIVPVSLSGGYCHRTVEATVENTKELLRYKRRVVQPFIRKLKFAVMAICVRKAGKSDEPEQYGVHLILCLKIPPAF